MYFKCLQKPCCLGRFKTSRALQSAVQKTRLNSSKDNFVAKSFRLSTKRKLRILLNFVFPFVSFIDVFFNPEMQNFSLQNHHIMNARQPFCILGDQAPAETQGRSVGQGVKARRTFSSTGGKVPWYRLSPDHFQTVKRILAPYWAQKMLCIIVPNWRIVSPEFFS